MGGQLFFNFLSEFRDEGGDGLPASQVEATYVRYLHELTECDRTTLFVDFNHLVECVPAARLRACLPAAQARTTDRASLADAPSRFDDTLAHEAVAAQFYRFEPYLRKALQVRGGSLGATTNDFALTLSRHGAACRTSWHSTTASTRWTTTARRSFSSRL